MAESEHQSRFPGADKPALRELPAIKDRLTFIYLEKAKISRKDSAFISTDQEGFVLIPAHSFLVVLCGPGTSVTHRAMELAAEAGVTFAWVGEGNLRFYCQGRPLTDGTALLVRQAKYVSTPRLHIEVVRKLYSLRYPDEDLTGLTLQQLRGKEGSRMRRTYREQAQLWGVEWKGRRYDKDDFSQGDPVNRALSVANACLYALCLSVIYAIGLEPGLGFIHVGHQKSLVYDIADLYKAEITIPLSFRIGSKNPPHLERVVRTELRKEFVALHLIERIVADLKYVFDVQDFELLEEEPLCLWDNHRPCKEAGIQYFPAEKMQME